MSSHPPVTDARWRLRPMLATRRSPTARLPASSCSSTWFATSFDTDDWLYRVLTIVQMGGVLALAVGIAVVQVLWLVMLLLPPAVQNWVLPVLILAATRSSRCRSR